MVALHGVAALDSHIFFIPFAFQKWQHEMYLSCKETGISAIETGHALKFPGCTNMGSASLLRDLQWHGYVKDEERVLQPGPQDFWMEQLKLLLGPAEDRA